MTMMDTVTEHDIFEKDETYQHRMMGEREKRGRGHTKMQWKISFFGGLYKRAHANNHFWCIFWGVNTYVV